MIELSRRLETLEPEPREHIKRVIREFAAEASEKYVNGQIEHGGYLPSMGVSVILNHAIEEAIDMVVYLYSVREIIRAKANDPR